MQRLAAGESVSSLAKSFKTSRQTIMRVRERMIVVSEISKQVIDSVLEQLALSGELEARSVPL